ncbi:MAG: DUF418 domain-containing protein [Pseudomonadota bacterium]
MSAHRIDALDTLRGIALFGVLTVNLITAFRVSIFTQFLPPETSASMLDGLVAAFVRHGLEMKAFAIFSLLFGVGLGIQHQQLSKRKSPLYWLTRRMLVLLGFGLLHLLLLWNGDILVAYSLAGLLVLPLLAARSAVLLVASALMFALYLYGLPVAWPEASWLQQHVAMANHIYANGTYAQIVRFGIGEIPYLIPLHAAVFPRTLALFLLGAWVWRSGVLADIGAHRRLLLSVGGIGLLGGGALAVAGFANAASILLALGFAAAVVACNSPILRVFAPAGRMAFSNYIAQSVVLSLVFFGYGLGQFGQHGPAAAFAFGVLLFALQSVLSAFWLRHFRFGPLEWLWRTLMYGRIPEAPAGDT